MIELDAWEIEDIRRDLIDIIGLLLHDDDDLANTYVPTDAEVLTLADRIVSIHEMHVARAIRSSMVAGLKRIENIP